ncbi:MAG: topoisomerase DNA-binding C4 zinc finger domain-containing protein [Eubacteriales bacterium]
MNYESIKKPNIKKKKSMQHIHFAIIAKTGELVSIESVKSGLACECICAACGRLMEARKGNVRRHHFAHVSNYDCLYGYEISIYKAFYSILTEMKSLLLPAAVLQFNSNKKDEIVKHEVLQLFTDVTFNCYEDIYPPILICYVDEKKLQLILDFDNYYSSEDLQAFKQIAKDNDISSLIIHISEVNNLNTLDELKPYITANPYSKEWIYNRVIEDYGIKYKSIAVKPAEFMGGHICFAQKNKYKNVYSARWDDCIKCQYCYDIHSKSFCLAHSYINHVEDFKKPLTELKKTFDELNNIEPLLEISHYKCPICGANLRRIKGKNGVFAGCSSFPQCKKTFSVEPTTEQIIID